ncbi:MAG: DedA family protein [Candidatus Edwardsbacteria bacterium]
MKLVSAILESGLLVYPLLFAIAFSESVFPPLPTDVVTLFAAYLVSQGKLNLVLSYLSIVSGSVSGVLILYYLVLKKGKEVLFLKRKKFFQDRVKDLERHFGLYEDLLLLSNRFLSGIRPLIFVAAGLSETKWSKVIWEGLVSALIWNAVLFWLGIFLGNKSQEILTKILVGAMLFVILSVLGLTVSKKIKGKEEKT